MAANTNTLQCQAKNAFPVQLEPEKRISKAREIIKKFPVTKEMFPQINFQQKWIVCK